jgi:chloramphenicol O-acetyltransferase type A
MKIIDLDTWRRKEHFEFFSTFDEPFFGLVSEIDCTIAYKTAKEKNYSFFASYLHKSLAVANEIEEFRYRYDGKEVILFDEIHASPTIGRDDGTFGFSFVEFRKDFSAFNKSLSEEIEKVKTSAGLRLNKDARMINVIHFSSIPWFSFTGLTHARNYKVNDSAPKITFGKMIEKDGRKIMPVAVNAHHGLVDGLHVGLFMEKFQAIMNNE